MTIQVLLTVDEAAARTKISKHTLNRWRMTGEGPPFIKFGPRLVRYAQEKLDAWMNERECASTQDYSRRL